MLAKLPQASLRINAEKCISCTDIIEYIEHLLHHNGPMPLLKKTYAILVLQPPMNVKQQCTVIIIVKYY